MKYKSLSLLIVAASFGFGFAFNSFINYKRVSEKSLKRVTGIGGIFFKCKNPDKIKEWYKTHLSLNTNAYGTVFEWYQGGDSTKKGFTQWSPFPESTNYFGQSNQDFMINYRVVDLVALVTELKKEGVTLADTIETYDYGKFVHILDAEGNKVELWEPNDVEYEKLGKQIGGTITK